MAPIKTGRNLNKIYAPLLYIAGWYTSSQISNAKLAIAAQDGTSSKSVAWVIVLITISAYLIWKATSSFDSMGSDESGSKT
jgi:hypothetical protein